MKINLIGELHFLNRFSHYIKNLYRNSIKIIFNAPKRSYISHTQILLQTPCILQVRLLFSLINLQTMPVLRTFGNHVAQQERDHRSNDYDHHQKFTKKKIKGTAVLNDTVDTMKLNNHYYPPLENEHYAPREHDPHSHYHALKNKDLHPHTNNFTSSKNHSTKSLSTLNANDLKLKPKNVNKNLSTSTKTLNKNKFYSEDEYFNDDTLTQHYYYYQKSSEKKKKKSKR